MGRVWVLVAALVLFGTAGAGSVLSAEPVVAQTTASGLCDTAEVEQFTDVADGDYGAAYMWCMRALKLSTGIGGGGYGPDRDLNRAQMASFLVRLWRDVLGNQCPTAMTSPFTDVAAGSTHAANIDCLYGLGITTGTTATTYGPQDPLKASQITRFLYRTFNKTGNTACSSGSGPELDRAAACLLQLHVIPSQAEATATTPVTRAQMGVYLIGLWHNVAGKGLPPTPPQLNQPTIQPTTTTTQPTQEPTTSHITFVFLEGSNQATWVVNADGTNPQQITTEGESPQWSPDGTRIAYEHGGIWVMNADGTNPQHIATTPAENPQWSPDGTRIAYEEPGIWVASPDGTNLKQLTNDGMIPRWSPDGTRISYTGSRFLRWVVNADGTNPRQLTTEAAITHWSPDGTRIAYSHAGDIWVADADGTNLKQLTTTSIAAENPQWSPDSTRIVYSDNGVWIVNADGTNLNQLTINSARYQQWSPDSIRLAYYNNINSIVIADADGSNPRQIVRIHYVDQTDLFSVTYHFDNSLQWSPDSTKILFYIGVTAVENDPA